MKSRKTGASTSFVPSHDISSMWRTYGHCDCFRRLQQHLSLATNERFPPETDPHAGHRAPKNTGNVPRRQTEQETEAGDTIGFILLVALRIFGALSNRVYFYFARSVSFSTALIPNLNSDWTTIKPKKMCWEQCPESPRCTVGSPIPSRPSSTPSKCRRLLLNALFLCFIIKPDSGRRTFLCFYSS